MTPTKAQRLATQGDLDRCTAITVSQHGQIARLTDERDAAVKRRDERKAKIRREVVDDLIRECIESGYRMGGAYATIVRQWAEEFHGELLEIDDRKRREGATT